jgi:ADP-ribosylglycohydrolase
LDGLSVGDGFGEQFFGAGMLRGARRELPPGPWRTTDDTEMACVLFQVLVDMGRVDPEVLAMRFAERHASDPDRGYGPGAHRVLREIARGTPWQKAAQASFAGQGSRGNGAAMRVAPLGGWFADDVDRLVHEARESAQVTHAHPDGQAGAVAVALAAAAAARGEPDLLEFVLGHLRLAGPTREGIEQASSLGALPPFEAARRLGNGSQVLASDTVPLCLWLASRDRDYESSLWETASLFGDVDTTCAIVGGIVALRAPIPAGWLAARESLRL